MCDLTCFVDGSASADPIAGVEMAPARSLGLAHRRADFDAIVYTIGNSPFHLETYELAMTQRGIAWLHEVNLTGLQFHRALHSTPADPTAQLRSLVHTSYGTRSNWIDFGAPRFAEELAERGRYLSREISLASDQVIVTSEVARRMWAMDCGLSADTASVVPLAFPATAEALAERGGNERSIVASFGFLHEAKHPAALLETLALFSPAERPLLVFVGENILADPAAFQEQLAASSLAGDVMVTGRLDDQDYESWMSRADVVIQLRRDTNGEGSATITEAMAAGRPVITNVASARELPSDALVSVGFDITPAELSQVMRELIHDVERREHIGRRAVEVASAWQFDDVARALLTIAAPGLTAPATQRGS